MIWTVPNVDQQHQIQQIIEWSFLAMNARTLSMLLGLVTLLAFAAGCESNTSSVPANSFRVTPSVVASDETQIKKQFTLITNKSGMVYSTGLGTQPDRLNGILNQPIEGTSTFLVTASIVSDPDGSRSLAVLLESDNVKTGPIKMPLTDDVTLEDAVSFSVEESADFDVNETVTLAKLGDKTLIVLVLDK